MIKLYKLIISRFLAKSSSFLSWQNCMFLEQYREYKKENIALFETLLQYIYIYLFIFYILYLFSHLVSLMCLFLVDLMVGLVSFFNKSVKHFSKFIVSFYMSTSSIWYFNFLYIFNNTFFGIVCFLNFSQYKGLVQVFYHAFNLHFFNKMVLIIMLSIF